MKFNVFDLYNRKTGCSIECAIIKTNNAIILITVLDTGTKVREYATKRELVHDLMMLKKKTKSEIIR